MFSYSRWLVCIAALLMMAASPLLFAATQNAVLYGVVYDAAGNPAAGVSVSLENSAIGMACTTHDVEQASPLAGASFSVAGNRPATNSFLLDGVDNVASSSNQAVPFQVNDAVQEFRITSGTANAEYGRNAGGTVNIVTRRGGNGFHGSTFGYFNNDMFNSSSPLSVYSGSTFDKAAAYAGPVNATAGGFL